MSEPVSEVVAIDEIDARLSPYDWPFAEERRAEIDALWAQTVAAKPKMFNGRVLLQHQGEARGGVFTARYFETDYANLLAWSRFGHPAPVRNGFAMAALLSRDKAWLLGVMGPHTANAGRIYFAAGTPDRSDILADGRVDLAGSAERELCEETGLRRDEVIIEAGWAVALSAARAAFMRPVRIDLPAHEARRLILSRIAQQAEPELADIHIVRSLADLPTERAPRFMIDYLASPAARARL
ncbi:MAG: hypothetical protein BGP06_09060 [Rhizobiales bacterium 65-9]|nr:NUDIX hydrolase [Hyphomicrobiales bacterium]OJY38616.1 MAG: hypothetical protein BGP06_09060 [Rhizobiales bacterium 65-9]